MTIRRGRKVTALGVLFTNFKTDKNLYHQNIPDMIKEDWVREILVYVVMLQLNLFVFEVPKSHQRRTGFILTCWVMHEYLENGSMTLAHLSWIDICHLPRKTMNGILSSMLFGRSISIPQ